MKMSSVIRVQLASVLSCPAAQGHLLRRQAPVRTSLTSSARMHSRALLMLVDLENVCAHRNRLPFWKATCERAEVQLRAEAQAQARAVAAVESCGAMGRKS